MSKNWSRAGDAGPLAPYADGCGAWLERVGYAPSSAQQRLWLMGHLSRWLDVEGVEAGSLTPTVLETFVAARHAAGWAFPPSPGVLLSLLAYLHAVGVAAATEPEAEPSAAEAVLERFREHLTIERGLSGRSALLYLQAVRPFVAAHVSGDTRGLSRLTAGDVTRFVFEVTRECGLGKAKTTMTALRALLRFLHREGVVASSLVGVVPTPASRRLAGLPRALTSEQVAALMAACDRGTASGRRDFAIVLLLVRLGLRAGEVAGLALEDLDWRAGEIIVRGKGGHCERLPLPDDVGGALVAWLQHGRPVTAQGRSVFVRLKAPHHRLSVPAVSRIVSAAGQRAGLGPIGAHRLRHTVATGLLAAGAPLAEIGHLLRHRWLSVTAIYAKVDRRALAAVARPWPRSAA